MDKTENSGHSKIGHVELQLMMKKRMTHTKNTTNTAITNNQKQDIREQHETCSEQSEQRHVIHT